MNRITVVSACLVAWFAGRGVAAQSPVLSPTEFAADLARRAEAIRPTAEETRWQRIPWVRSVIDGQKAARAEKRPIMYWHVDDDPLERC
jgi:hypothetical protein